MSAQVKPFLKCQLCGNGTVVNMTIMAIAEQIVLCFVYFRKHFSKIILANCFCKFNLLKISRYMVVTFTPSQSLATCFLTY